MSVSSSQSRVTISLNLVGQAASVRGLQQTTAALKDLQTVASDANVQLAASSEAAAAKIDTANSSIASSAQTAAAKVTAATDEVKASQTALADTSEKSAVRVNAATASASSGLVGLLTSFKALSVGAATYLGVKAFTSYSTSLTQLSTLAGLTQKQVASLNSEIMRTAPALRQSPAALAQAAYSPASERFGLAGTEQVINYAARLTNLSGNPIGGGAGSTSYAISTMLQTLGMKPTAANVAKVTAMIRGTTSAGDMQLTDLTGAMSTGVLNTGKTYGIDPEATLGALAYFTSQGVPAQEAATRMRMTESLLVGQTAQAAKYGQALGLNVSTAGETGLSAQLAGLGLSPTKMAGLVRQGPGGLNSAFQLINQSLASLPQDQREAVWAKLFGGGRTDATAMQLAQGATNGQLSNFTQAVIGSSSVQGLNQATQQYNNSPQGKLKQFEAELQTFATQFGSVVMPVLEQLMNILGPLLNLFAHHKMLLDALTLLIGGELAVKLLGLVKNLKLVSGAMNLIRDARAFSGIVTGAEDATSAVGKLIQKISGVKDPWAGGAGRATETAAPAAADTAGGAVGVGLLGGATVAGGLAGIAAITGYGLYLGINPSKISAGAAYADSFGMPAKGGLPQALTSMPDLSNLKGYAAGGVTDGPMAIVGEGSPRWPEYVVPTDPAYRSRALALFQSLGGHLLGADPSFLLAMGPGAKGKTPTGISGGGGSNSALGQRMAAALGWTGREWAALNALWTQESGWNNLARNPSSGAYGIAQALPATKYPLAGQAAGGSSSAAQIGWGLNYIKCVPLDSLILTKEGWKSHDEVQVNDETIGYDPGTGTSRWTRITAVHHYGGAPVVRMYNSRISVRCTPNHRWLTEKIIQTDKGTYRREEMVATDRIGSRHRIRVAAPHVGDSELPISDEEATLLGWIAGDGCIYLGRNNRGGKRGKLNVSVSQSKPRWMAELRALMAGFPHSEYVDTHENHWSRAPKVTFRLASKYARDLLARSGYRADMDQMVLHMSASQRRAFINGFWMADGHQPTKGSRMIAQNEGPKLDAVSLALYLEGIYGHRVDSSNQKHVSFSRPWLKGGIPVEDAGEESVWCVTTELGSWTMLQEGQILLTGNSRYGDPAGAEAHEKNFGWYAKGGVLPFASYDTGGFLPEGISIAHNGTGSPEPVGHDRAGGDLIVHVVLDGKTVGETVIRDFRKRAARR